MFLSLVALPTRFSKGMTTSQNQGEGMKFKAENLAETPEKLGLNDGPMGQKTWKPFRSYRKTMEKLWKRWI